MRFNYQDVLLGLVFGILLGMVITFVLLMMVMNNFVNEVLPKIEIQNINFDLNETALVQEMNNTFGGVKYNGTGT